VQPGLYATCAVCRKPILPGQVCVSICRNVEHIEPNHTVSVSDSVVLSTLCATCGDRFPEGAIRIGCGDLPGGTKGGAGEPDGRTWFSQRVTATGGGRELLDFDTRLEVIQPDYQCWQAVRIGMAREEVMALLGPPQRDSPIGPPETYSTYGHLLFPLMPHPHTYSFIVGFDDQDRVFTKSDPFGGILSLDGTPSKPKIIGPPEGAVFRHYPRVVDMRWQPVSGVYPIRYEVELGTALEMTAPFTDRVIESELPLPYYVVEAPGDQPARFRVRGRNARGVGEWSDFRYFDFSPRP
jgi:hypothetical protein